MLRKNGMEQDDLDDLLLPISTSLAFYLTLFLSLSSLSRLHETPPYFKRKTYVSGDT